MFASKEPLTKTRQILAGLFFIVLFTYTAISFFREHEIADPSLNASPEITFHTSNKTESTSGKKRYISDSSFEFSANAPKTNNFEIDNYETTKLTKITPPPPGKVKGPSLSISEIRDAQGVANSLSHTKNLESVFIADYGKEVKKRRRKVRRKLELWRQMRIKAGYPDPFFKKKRKKRKKKRNQTVKEIYAEYIAEKGENILNKSKPYIIPPEQVIQPDSIKRPIRFPNQ